MRKIKIISCVLLSMIICSSILITTTTIMSIEVTDPLIDRYNQTFLPVVYVENAGINTGTGMIIYSRYGYTFVLTAQHIAAYGDHPIVSTQYSNQFYPTTVIEKDIENDLAILKIDSYSDFGRPVKFLRKDEKVLVYETIYSVGHTLSKEAIATSGQVASSGRSWRDGRKYITINSPVYGGSSGGPTYIARRNHWYDRLPTYYVMGMVSKGDGHRGMMISHIVYVEDYKTITNFLEKRGLHFIFDQHQTPQQYLEKRRLEQENEK